MPCDAGRALEARGDLTAATIAYERAVRARSGSAVAHDKLGFVLGRQNRIPEALAEFARAIKLDPTLFDAQYHLGATKWWTRDLEGALGPLRAAVRLRPDHAEARYYLGTTLRQLGRIPEAVTQLREAVSHRHCRRICSSEWRPGLGDPRARDEPAAGGARSIGPRRSTAWDSRDAEWQWRRSRRDVPKPAAHPSYAAGRLNLATTLMHQGDLAGAVELLDGITSEQPDNAEAFYNLGVALKQRDDFDRAEVALRRAVALDSHLSDPPFTLGVVLWQTGRAAEAEQLFKEAIKRNKDSADAHYMLGTLLKTSGRTDEALGEFKEAVRLRPDSIEAHQSSARCCSRRATAPANAARQQADRLAARPTPRLRRSQASGVRN